MTTRRRKNKLHAGSPEELKEKARRCAAKALQWLLRGAEYERSARRAERKLDHIRMPWHCRGCGAVYATDEQLAEHHAGKLAPFKCPVALDRRERNTDTPETAAAKADAAAAVGALFSGLAKATKKAQAKK